MRFDELANSDGRYSFVDHRDVDGFGDGDGVLMEMVGETNIVMLL